jgi:hypothetical protein
VARQNPLRSWLAATLSIAMVVPLGLLMVRPVPAGAAGGREILISVSDTGFNPSIIGNVNVGDALIFVLNKTTNQHTVTFKDDSTCLGERGAVPCWPELRFDTDTKNCHTAFGTPEHWRCLEIRESGATVQFHDAFHPANVGEVRVLGQPTTTTGPSTTTTTRPPTTTTTAPTSTTLPPTSVTTSPQATTTTAPTQVRPFEVPDPPPTTSTAPVAVSVTPVSPGPAPTAPKDKNKDQDKGKAKEKAAGAETPTTDTSVAPDALPPDAVFDPSTLTPSPTIASEVPGAPGAADVNLDSSAIMNLLDVAAEEKEPTDYGLLLLALGGLALVLSIGGLCIWFGRPSRYDPA